jgi:hypothetical protein
MTDDRTECSAHGTKKFMYGAAFVLADVMKLKSFVRI